MFRPTRADGYLLQHFLYRSPVREHMCETAPPGRHRVAMVQTGNRLGEVKDFTPDGIYTPWHPLG